MPFPIDGREPSPTGAAASERPAVRCPICRRLVEPALFARHTALQPVVRDALGVLHSGWRPDDGACPNCVGRALAALTSSGFDLQRVLLHAAAHTDNPLVAAAGEPALPVPLRLHANPLFRGAGQVLGMIDSGFYPHADLTLPRNRIRLTVDAMADPPIEDADFSRPALRSWHGLMTSVVAAGNGHLAGGRYRGIASEAGLVLARVGLPNLRIPDAAIAVGMRWMLANHARFGIRVVNMSLGGDEELPAAQSELDQLAEALVAEGVLVVVAAGNSGKQAILPPASAPHVLTVGGATDQNVLQVHLDEFVRWQSSYGPTLDGYQKPEVVAPSMLLAAPVLPGTRQARDAAILARLVVLDDADLARMAQRDEARRALGLRGALDLDNPAAIRDLLAARMAQQKWLSAYYQFVDGTSVAAPVVSSIAVQMIEANPRLTPALIKTLLMATAVPMRGVPAQMQGHGVVNPAGAVAAALRAPGGPLAGYPLSPQVLPERGITFYYYNPRVERVALVGDLNGWFAAGFAFTRLAPGVFRLVLPPLPPGRHLYKFLLDDTTAVPDPENLHRAPDGYGDFNSFLEVERET